MLPQWPHLGLTAHVPHGEADVDVLHSLHIEADGGQGGHQSSFPPAITCTAPWSCNFIIVINTSHLLPAPQPIIDLTQAVEASQTRTRTALVTLLSRVNN